VRCQSFSNGFELSFWSSGFGGFDAPHGVALDVDAMGIVDQTIEDGVGVGGVADEIMPFGDR
jgi:hypothetical protein